MFIEGAPQRDGARTERFSSKKIAYPERNMLAWFSLRAEGSEGAGEGELGAGHRVSVA